MAAGTKASVVSVIVSVKCAGCPSPARPLGAGYDYRKSPSPKIQG